LSRGGRARPKAGGVLGHANQFQHYWPARLSPIHPNNHDNAATITLSESALSKIINAVLEAKRCQDDPDIIDA